MPIAQNHWFSGCTEAGATAATAESEAATEAEMAELENAGMDDMFSMTTMHADHTPILCGVHSIKSQGATEAGATANEEQEAATEADMGETEDAGTDDTFSTTTIYPEAGGNHWSSLDRHR